MTRKTKTALITVCLLLTVTVVYALAAAGGASDPLASLSYLTGTFTAISVIFVTVPPIIFLMKNFRICYFDSTYTIGFICFNCKTIAPCRIGF